MFIRSWALIFQLKSRPRAYSRELIWICGYGSGPNETWEQIKRRGGNLKQCHSRSGFSCDGLRLRFSNSGIVGVKPRTFGHPERFGRIIHTRIASYALRQLSDCPLLRRPIVAINGTYIQNVSRSWFCMCDNESCP